MGVDEQPLTLKMWLYFMKWNSQHRQYISVAIILFYLAPLFILTTYSLGIMSREKSWSILSLGMSFLMLAALTLIVLIRNWEASIRAYFQQRDYSTMPTVNHVMSKQVDPKVTNFESLLENKIPEELPLNIETSPYRQDDGQLNLLINDAKKLQEESAELRNILASKDQLIEQLTQETAQLQTKELQISQDFSDYKLFADEQLRQKNLQIGTLQQSIDDQRNEMEKRLEQIHHLDTKVHDLSFEIKTLLYLNDSDFSGTNTASGQEKSAENQTVLKFGSEQSQFGKNETQTLFNQQITNHLEAQDLLKHCMEIAEKLSGPYSIGHEVNRYRDLQSSRYAIDQRRLFDSLREETSSLILVYSLKENKIIFVNGQSKTLLGWTPEKFVIDFSQIIQSSLNDWKTSIQELANQTQAQARLLVKTKSGVEILVNCLLGSVTTGLFRQHAIGVLYKS